MVPLGFKGREEIEEKDEAREEEGEGQGAAGILQWVAEGTRHLHRSRAAEGNRQLLSTCRAGCCRG